jgi:hypothetical protein
MPRQPCIRMRKTFIEGVELIRAIYFTQSGVDYLRWDLFYKILSTVYLFKNMQKNIVKLT